MLPVFPLVLVPARPECEGVGRAACAVWADDDCFVCKYEEVTAAMPNFGDTFIIIT